MTQENKQLLLKDLCSRLPYGVICHTEEGDGYLCSINQTIFRTEYGLNINPLKRDYFNDSESDEQAIKPYLRPMSSMTKEEEEEYELLIDCSDYTYFKTSDKVIDWLNAHHFDYHGLIPMGLAFEAPKDMFLELAKKILLKTGKVVLASNYPEGCSFEDGFHLGYNEGFNAKKEQKLIKWTDLTWKDIVELEGIINNVHYDFNAGIGQESFGKEVLERFRSLKGIEYLDEVESNKVTINGEPISTENQSVDIPLAEWSEEDEASYNAFMCEVVNEKMNPTIEQIKWLRGIRDKLKSLPSIKKEWSEEDERIIDTIVSVLGQYVDYKTVSGTGSGYATPRYTKEIEWLKSLRPSWKPSEEQIYSLGTVVKGSGDCAVGSVGYNLKELYEQLKTLM